MILILEGLDASGKDTLAESLAKSLSLKIVNPDRHFVNHISFSKDLLSWEYILAGDFSISLPMLREMDDFIRVRFHITQNVYSQVFGRKSFVKFNEVDLELKKYSLSKKIVIVYLSISYEIHSSRQKARSERPLDYSMFLKQQKLFEKSLVASELSILRIDANKSKKSVLNDTLVGIKSI